MITSETPISEYYHTWSAILWIGFSICFFLRSFSFRICFIPQLNSQHTTLNKSLCVPYIISSCLFCSMCLCMSECVYANNPFRPMRSALLSLKLPIWIFRFVNIHTLCAYVCLCLRTLRCVCVRACVRVCLCSWLWIAGFGSCKRINTYFLLVEWAEWQQQRHCLDHFFGTRCVRDRVFQVQFDFDYIQN